MDIITYILLCMFFMRWIVVWHPWTSLYMIHLCKRVLHMGDMNHMALECSKQSHWMIRLDILLGLHCSMINFYMIEWWISFTRVYDSKVNKLVYMIHWRTLSLIYWHELYSVNGHSNMYETRVLNPKIIMNSSFRSGCFDYQSVRSLRSTPGYLG